MEMNALAERPCCKSGVLPKSIFWRLALALCLLFFLGLTQAEELQSLSALEQAVSDYLEALQEEGVYRTQIRVTPLDSRLRLAACQMQPELFIPSGRRPVGNTVVGVRCAAPVPWTVYVQANVALMQRVLVAARPLPRGAILSESDVVLEEQDVSRQSLDVLQDIKHIKGLILKRSVASGMILHTGLLQAQASIRRGEKVTILGQLAGIDVRMEGVALVDGAKGEVIRVRNLSSGREVEAVVVAPGVVQVRL